MERTEITAKLEGIFKQVFNHEDISINDEMTANDVDQWDSLSHMLLISTVESEFNVKFKLRDLNKMKNVGDMINIIQSKI